MSHPTHPDPLRHINIDHLDELLAIARAFGGQPDGTSARAEGVDREGIDLVIDTTNGPEPVRVEFVQPVLDYPDGVRAAFVELTVGAWKALR